MRSAIVVAALVPLACGLVACDNTDDQGSGGRLITQPAGSSAPATDAPRTGAPDGTPQTDAPGAAPTDPGTETPTAAPGTGPVPTGLPSRDDATVDARDYQNGDNFYFQSPTGNIMCGILYTAPFGVGCQLASTNVIPPQLPNCDDAPQRKVAVHLVDGKAEFLCTSQGIFVGIPSDGSGGAGGKTLNYGDTIIVRGTACTSTPQGVRCDAGGHGFTISADGQTLF